MLEMVKNYPAIMQYLPDEKEIHLLPRQWIANVIYTIVGKDFEDWVTRHIKARHEKYASKNNLLISMDPEIAEALNNSAQISSKLVVECNCVM